MYVGCARHKKDVSLSLELAAKTFRSDELSSEAIVTKQYLMSVGETLRKQDIVILENNANEIIGTCFLIDRLFYFGRVNITGTFLTSICIDELSRGKGYSELLMNAALAECENRGSIFAVLIARRAVDHFYNKFGFWGVSQYAKISINLVNVYEKNNRLTESTPTIIDLPILNTLYESAYSKLLGSLLRSQNNWKNILWKTELQKIRFIVVRKNGTLCGYVIFSGCDLYEVAVSEDASYIELLCYLKDKYSLGNVSIYCAPQHPIVYSLAAFDYSITLRQCNYGGHMVRVIDYKYLLRLLQEKSPMLYEEKVRIDFAENQLGFEDTCLMMGMSYLSMSPMDSRTHSANSFNIPLVDQS